MIKTNVWLIAFPDEECRIERVDLKILMQRALRIEVRMEKGVNLEQEQGRYHTLCDRIEYYGHLIAISDNAVVHNLGANYLASLIPLQKSFPEAVKKSRLMASFSPSELLGRQLEQLLDLVSTAGHYLCRELMPKIQFYQQAVKNGWNIIELQEVISDYESVSEINAPDNLRDEFLSLHVRDDITTGADANPYVGLRNQIRAVVGSITRGEPAAVNFSDLGHHVIAEILNEMVYSKGTKISVPITYADGSQASPFPLFCLRPRQIESVRFAFKDEPLIKVGMMSQRHPELDPTVKIYIFRNQEISIGKPAGEIDETAYRKAKELFAKSRSEGKYRIAFYQTGFQPAIVGFYRALTEELIQRSYSLPSLQVTPYYFLGENYKEGKTWV